MPRKGSNGVNASGAAAPKSASPAPANSPPADARNHPPHGELLRPPRSRQTRPQLLQRPKPLRRPHRLAALGRRRRASVGGGDQGAGWEGRGYLRRGAQFSPNICDFAPNAVGPSMHGYPILGGKRSVGFWKAERKRYPGNYQTIQVGTCFIAVVQNKPPRSQKKRFQRGAPVK